MGQCAGSGQRIGRIRPDTSYRQISPVSLRPPADRSDVTNRPTVEGPTRFEVASEPAIRPVPPPRRPRRTAVIVNEEGCISCGVCAEVCPVNAVSIVDTAVIDSTRCVGCGLCVNQCPGSIITLAETPPVETVGPTMAKSQPESVFYHATGLTNRRFSPAGNLRSISESGSKE
jgi:ferredoxin